MEQLTDAELEALIGPEAGRLMDTLPQSELEALSRGDPAATLRYQRVRRSGQHRGDVCA